MRRRIESEQPSPTRSDVTVADAGDRLVSHLEALGRKPSTLSTYRSLLTVHLKPRLGGDPIARVTIDQVEQLIAAMRADGKSPKLIRNALTLLYQVFEFGQRKGWCQSNPVKSVDRPQLEESTDIHFLEIEEVEALLRAVPEDDPLGPTDRVLYLTAAMTGLRQGELLALRWRDVDWAAGRVRVRQNYVRGHWGTPKSRRGSRSVPLADRVAGELERHFQRSPFQGDDDLVFPHPHTGNGPRPLRPRSGATRRRSARRRSARSASTISATPSGRRMAASGVPLRTLQEWMGHRDFKTTLIYADYSPSAHEGEMVEAAFRGPIRGPNLSETEVTSDDLTPLENAESDPTEPPPQG